jgi:chemotaxis protein methyltransferase CheR
MKDTQCIAFLQWCLPRLRLRWEGFRKVRGQVCKRIDRRLNELNLPDITAYRQHIKAHAEEWELLDEMCRITISRFYRDRRVYDHIGAQVLPRLATIALEQSDKTIRCWSAGCASGEEPYGLNILWKTYADPSDPLGLKMTITATEALKAMIERCRRGIYPSSSIKDLPEKLLGIAFERRDDTFALRDQYREGIAFIRQDLRREAPAGMFHLIMCRNLAFTYFEDQLQEDIFYIINQHLVPGGFLAIGVHESLPVQMKNYTPAAGISCIYEKSRQEGN